MWWGSMYNFLLLMYIFMVDKVVNLQDAKGFKVPQPSQKQANFKTASSHQFKQNNINFISKNLLSTINFYLATEKSHCFFLLLCCG